MRAGEPAAEPRPGRPPCSDFVEMYRRRAGYVHIHVSMSMLAGQRDVIEAIAAPVLASSARTDVKAKLQFAVIASFGSGSIRHGRARSARPPEAAEPDDEEVPARMKTVVQYLVAGTATLALAGTGFAADVLVYPPEGPVRGAAEQGFLGVLQLGQGAERRRSRRPAPAGAARPARPRRGRGGGARRRARRGGRGDRRRRREGCGRGGAVVGGVHGRRRSMAAQQAQQQATRSAYDRAFAACMEGRGYTVR